MEKHQVDKLVLIADGLLWDHGVGDCPGPLRPDAKQRLDAARARAKTVVVVSYCAATTPGAARCRSLLERELQSPLGRTFDLHVGNGFPVFDALIHE